MPDAKRRELRRFVHDQHGTKKTTSSADHPRATTGTTTVYSVIGNAWFRRDRRKRVREVYEVIADKIRAYWFLLSGDAMRARRAGVADVRRSPFS